MSRKILIALVVLFSLALAGAIGFIAYQEMKPAEVPTEPSTTAAPSSEVTTEATTVPETTEPVPSVMETTPPTTEATEPPTEATTAPTETEPTEARFLLTFVGDCTFGSVPSNYGVKYSFIDTIGENYDYPFDNVREYFEADDFTFANLEGVLADERMGSSSQFPFRGPTAYTQILTGSSVEAVTLANNHTMDFGEKGLSSTKDALDAAGVTYVEKNGSAIYTTGSGLTIGMYAVNFTLDQKDMETEIKALRKQGAEIVIVAFHWGSEGVYRANSGQVNYAHAAIDAGADIVYGSHPHVLQKVEEYGDGIIYYSLGNFCFGGNNFPKDLDSAILQQEVIRDLDGSIRLGELTMIPVSVSSMEVQNNFQPTPYKEGTKEYDRTISKLDGSFKGPNLYVNYDKEPAATTPATQQEAATTPPVAETVPAAPAVPDAETPEA